MPLLVGQLPVPKRDTSVEKPAENKQVVYAASNLAQLDTTDKLDTDFKTLILFTHTHEAYEPIVKSVNGKVTTSDAHTNIFTLKDMIASHFQLNGIETDVLDVDNMEVLNAQGKNYYQAYNTMRPYIQERLKKQQYNLVIDFHRDAAKHEATTVTVDGTSYARIAIVIGTDHANYRWNLTYGEKLSKSLNEIVPNISRGVISKGGEGVDGKYNQDLSKTLVLIELGGIGNNEEELNRSVSVLAKAIAKAFRSEDTL